MRIKRIHHLTLAVRDIEAARRTFEQLFGAPAGVTEPLPAFSVRTASVRLGDDQLQLAAPMYTDTPVMRFLERKGEGFYNVAIEVEDLDEAITELVAKGIRVSEPVEAEPGLRSSFVTMAATHGLSVQLVEVIGGAPRASLSDAVDAGDDADDADVADDPPVAEATTIIEEPASEHLAAAADGGTSPPLDLTPDEWSDVD